MPYYNILPPKSTDSAWAVGENRDAVEDLTQPGENKFLNKIQEVKFPLLPL